MKKINYDVIIIGAGPAGMVAAGYLEKTAVSVRVLEKQHFPRFTIGESLIPRCMDNFAEAGLLEDLQKENYQKKTGARFIKNGKIAEFDFSKKFGAGWDWTWQVPRADFDLKLTESIQKRGVEIDFGMEVISAAYNDGQWDIVYKNPDGILGSLSSRFIIDASGNGRVLAGLLELEAPAKIYNHSSIFTHIQEENRPVGKEGTQITFEIINTGVWFWYIPFSNGISSLGFVGENDWFETFSGSQDEIFKQMLNQCEFYKDRFTGQKQLFEPVKLSGISKNVQLLHGEGFALAGNSAEFLDPVFSSGVAFATESGLLSAKLATRQLGGEVIDWDKEYTQHIQKAINVFATYVKEWYTGRLQDIFFTDNASEKVKKQICAVLAGYVWNSKNPFVRNHDKAIRNLHRLLHAEKIN
ncbi:NAD(P)/FAD-dependent oxidoreductase [Christiangramia portivictoriae]|uniref:NAD(P)/FAD-dependent oxidoreductase n=1 Tax=Christiangramia portivictoriae TaxID=326069 RepID=UPI0003FFED40|nr:NAD(P)/FAD-dependent oxidoreductase [Christiangramia portivictoriae]